MNIPDGRSDPNAVQRHTTDGAVGYAGVLIAVLLVASYPVVAIGLLVVVGASVWIGRTIAPRTIARARRRLRRQSARRSDPSPLARDRNR